MKNITVKNKIKIQSKIINPINRWILDWVKSINVKILLLILKNLWEVNQLVNIQTKNQGIAHN